MVQLQLSLPIIQRQPGCGGAQLGSTHGPQPGVLDVVGPRVGRVGGGGVLSHTYSPHVVQSQLSLPIVQRQPGSGGAQLGSTHGPQPVGGGSVHVTRLHSTMQPQSSKRASNLKGTGAS